MLFSDVKKGQYLIMFNINIVIQDMSMNVMHSIGDHQNGLTRRSKPMSVVGFVMICKTFT